MLDGKRKMAVETMEIVSYVCPNNAKRGRAIRYTYRSEKKYQHVKLNLT